MMGAHSMHSLGSTRGNPTPSTSLAAEKFRNDSVMKRDEPHLKRQDTQKRAWPISYMIPVILIIVINLVLLFGQAAWGSYQRQLDSDGDGVPDRLDKCPSLSTCFGVDCPPAGWLSGRSTDFDSDGCADGSEDRDKDNDGITDENDGCPATPQHYSFVSHSGNDFDHDGCMDRIEDIDDDNDLVLNTIDACPFTNRGEQSDHEGCAPKQRETLNPQQPQEPEEVETNEWWETFFNVALQFFLGSVLEQIMEKVTLLLQSFREPTIEHDSANKTTNTAEDVARSSKPWAPFKWDYGWRLVWFLFIVFCLRQQKCELSRMSSWFAFGFEAMGMQCDALAH